MVREFYDSKFRTHYSVEGWRVYGEDFPVVPKKERRSCAAFLRGCRIEGFNGNLVGGDEEIHFRNEPKNKGLRRVLNNKKG